MRRYVRFAAWLLAVMMLFSATGACTLAEEAGEEETTVEEFTAEAAQDPDPAEEEEPAPVEEPEAEPEEEPAQDPDPAETEAPAEEVADEPALEPAPEATEEPAPESMEEAAEAPAEEPEQAQAPAETEDPADEPEDTPAETPEEDSPFEQQVLIGATVVTVTAPAGAVAPDSQLVIRETKEEALVKAVLDASQAEGDVIRHRMLSFSGAEINGAVRVEIEEPLIQELADEYPGAEIAIYVYACQPDEALARRMNAEIKQSIVSFAMSEPAVYDVMIVIKLPDAEPTAEAETAETEPTETASAEPETEAAAEPTEEPEAEATAEITEEPEAEVTADPTEEPEAEATTEPIEEPEAEATTEPTEEPEAEATTEPTEEPETEATTEPTEEPETEATTDPTEEKVTDEKPADEPEAETTAEAAAEEPAAEPLTITVSAAYEGELQYGTVIVLTAVLSADDPEVMITWQYSPDGGDTVFTVEDEHSRTLTYTYTEDNRDYCWRAGVQSAPEE